ncbi:MAG: DUF3149 domain-containing protein [Gammaproteobacteria bacterium]|nr:DUF3149 domain-containing protein [Gammaproteobacteria bacterium]
MTFKDWRVEVKTVEIWKELLGTYVGLLSLAVIIAVFLMGIFYTRMFIKKIKEAEAEQLELVKASKHHTTNGKLS